MNNKVKFTLYDVEYEIEGSMFKGMNVIYSPVITLVDMQQIMITTKDFSKKQVLGLLNTVKFCQNGTVSAGDFMLVNIIVLKSQLGFVRAFLATKAAMTSGEDLYYPPSTDQYPNCSYMEVEVPEKEEKVPIVKPIEIHKKETRTYLEPDRAAVYVNSSYDRRVMSMVNILASIGSREYYFVQDGAGVGSHAAKMLHFSSKSCDVSDAMIALATDKGNEVVKARYEEKYLLPGTVVVLSHVLALDPGLLVDLLEERKKHGFDIVVFESKSGYKGQSQMSYEVDATVYATFMFKLIFINHELPTLPAIRCWYKLVAYDDIVVNEPSVCKHVKLLRVIGYNPVVHTRDERVKEILVQAGLVVKNYETIPDHVTVYSKKLLHRTTIAFNVHKGEEHVLLAQHKYSKKGKHKWSVLRASPLSTFYTYEIEDRKYLFTPNIKVLANGVVSAIVDLDVDLEYFFQQMAFTTYKQKDKYDARYYIPTPKVDALIGKKLQELTPEMRMMMGKAPTSSDNKISSVSKRRKNVKKRKKKT